MKKIVGVLFTALLLLVSTVPAQVSSAFLTCNGTTYNSTSAISRDAYPVSDINGFITGYAIDLTFTVDSATTLQSIPFHIPNYDGTKDASFRIKMPGETAAPQRDVFIAGLFSSTTDTVKIDTLSAKVGGQTEGDTTGVFDLNHLLTPRYGIRVIIRTSTDVAAGKLHLFFPVTNGVVKKRGM